MNKVSRFLDDFGGLIFLLILIAILGYSVIGTEGRVAEIKRRAPADIPTRNWRLLRYEGYERGAWGNHGGKVSYHVQDLANPNIQYRVTVTLYGGELQYAYGAPEVLSRLDITEKE